MKQLYCIKTHSQRVVVAGNWYPLISDRCPCKCDAIDVGAKCINDNGNPITETHTRCISCGAIYKSDGRMWVGKSLFANVQMNIGEQETDWEEAQQEEVLIER